MFKNKEEQFDFYWKEIFTGLAYNPIEFNTYRFDQTMSLPGKVNKLYDMFKVLAMNNQEVMDYLKAFVETFDEKLYETIEDVLTVWLEDGRLADVVRVAISEEVIEARTDYLGHDYLTLKERLDTEREEVILARNGAQTLSERFVNEKNAVTTQLAKITEQVVNVLFPPVSLSPILGDGSNELAKLQAIIDHAKQVNKSVIIPPNVNITLGGDLWLSDNTTIIGFGNSSQLTFTSGLVRAEKGGLRNFSKTTAYYNDYVPNGSGDYTSSLSSEKSTGSYDLLVTNTNGVEVGDVLYTFNNNLDAWKILENPAEVAKFNDHENYPLAQAEIFTVLAKTAYSIKLDRQTLFSLPVGSPVRKLLGAKNVKLSNFKLNFTGGQGQGILLEQVRDSIFESLTLDGAGFDLHNKCFRNKIVNNTIHSKVTRSITLDSFSSQNVVANNTIQYSHGGDSSILVMMANGNTVIGNTLNGSGEQIGNEIGITLHARSYGNTVTGNVIKGFSDGIGLYYAPFNNIVTGNTTISCAKHIQCYYASKNKITNHTSMGVNRDKDASLERGAFIYQSKDITIDSSTFEIAVYIENSKRVDFTNNLINTMGDGLYIIGENEQAEHVIKGNRIKAITGITISTTNYWGYENTIPTKIIDNIFDCVTNCINMKHLMYLIIKGNTFKNSQKGIYIQPITGISTIHDNTFINNTMGVDFVSDNVESLCSSVKGNTFKNVATPYSNGSNYSTVIAARGGVYGFTVYDIYNPSSSKKWVYTNPTSGLKGSENWVEIP